MALKSKVTSIPSPKRIDYKHHKQEHILSYDTDNKYPQRVEDIINDSKTVVSCLRFRERFIMGGGFTDSKFYKAVVNRKGLTTDKLLRLVSKDVSKWQSVALHVNYNAMYETVECNFIPWSNIRFSKSEDPKYDNKIAVYDDWGCVKKPKVQLKDIQFIDYYNPNPAVIQSQIDALATVGKDGEVISDGWDIYQGQIFIFTPNNGEYPLFYGDVALEYMQTEGEMKRFNYKSVKNNFLGSHFVVTGEKEEIGEDGNTIDGNSQLASDLSEFQGGDGTARLMLIEKSNPDDNFEVVKVELQDYDGLYEYTDKQCKDSIREVFNIPDSLFIAQQNKLSTSSEIDEAVSLYNGNTADERLIIEEIFTEIFSNWYYNINPSGDYSVIPYKYPKSSKQISPEYFPYYTVNEIREGNGDEPIEGGDVLSNITKPNINLQ